jgi:hypothetical protein
VYAGAREPAVTASASSLTVSCIQTSIRYEG